MGQNYWEEPFPTCVPMPRLGTGSSSMFSILWEAWLVWLQLWEHSRGGFENRFSFPTSQRPANHSYKYNLAWPSSLILTVREGVTTGAEESVWERGAVYGCKCFSEGPCPVRMGLPVENVTLKCLSLECGGLVGGDNFPQIIWHLGGLSLGGILTRLPT